jgi:uncharacterized membrane-anchored protein
LNTNLKDAVIKVPEVTLMFWVIKIIATTLGETGGDALSMSMEFGYLTSSVIFSFIFATAVFAQIKANSFNPALYWTTIIATTTLGTTIADYATRSLNIGYLGGSILLFALLIASLSIWYRSVGTIAVESINTSKSEIFYWVTIMLSQTLGTALGDWVADTPGLGYLSAAIIFSGLLLIIISLYFWTGVSRTLLFWTAFVSTRPLGAVLGDYLDKPLAQGGLALSRFSASAVLLVFIIVFVYFFSQRAAQKSH